jgi:hypothetical protein
MASDSSHTSTTEMKAGMDLWGGTQNPYRKKREGIWSLIRTEMKAGAIDSGSPKTLRKKTLRYMGTLHTR